MAFQLHPKLQADTHLISSTAQCQILLMDDARYPWIILVPQVTEIRELYELDEQQQQHVYRTILRVSKGLAQYTNAEKMNVAVNEDVNICGLARLSHWIKTTQDSPEHY